ncbi:MAG: protein phosphatase 2C domain-containing protein [Candidatus Oleimicrobiaceae bacterium]
MPSPTEWGAAAGAYASRLALKRLAEVFFGERASGDIGEVLKSAVRSAGNAIFHEGQADPSKTGMGTTLTAAAIRGNMAWIANVGDSRAYLIRNQKIVQLT